MTTVFHQAVIEAPALVEVTHLAKRYGEQRALAAMVTVGADNVAPGLYRLTVRVANVTPTAPALRRDEALLHTLASSHTVLRVENGQFVSLVDPTALRTLQADRDFLNKPGVNAATSTLMPWLASSANASRSSRSHAGIRTSPWPTP